MYLDIIKNFFQNHCSLSDVLTSQTPFGQIWKVIIDLPKSYWLYIVLGLSFVVTRELIMRHRNSYNSANGFTPEFNSLVGSLTYALLQIGLYFLIYLFFGNVAYCFPWPYLGHLLVFSITYTLLHRVGFWPNRPKSKGKRYRKKW